jgi:hypothetical protein
MLRQNYPLLKDIYSCGRLRKIIVVFRITKVIEYWNIEQIFIDLKNTKDYLLPARFVKTSLKQLEFKNFL